MLCHPSLLPWAHSAPPPSTYLPTLLTFTSTHFPTCSLGWLARSWFTWWRQCKCHYPETGSTACTQRLTQGFPSHGGSGNFPNSEPVSKAGVQRAALSSCWWSCSCLLFTSLVFLRSLQAFPIKYKLSYTKQNKTPTNKKLCCPSNHHLITPPQNLLFIDNVIWLGCFLFWR